MKNFYLATLVAAAALASCSEKDPFLWNKSGPDDGTRFSHDMIILGEQLQDPYSVDNMTKALASVYPAAAGRGSLQATDFYVRFLPKDDADMQLLLDRGVLMLDHPLDYRIVRDGDWYHDPSVPEDNITWQYAVVPVDFEFPISVRYERLDECYLSEHDPVTKTDGIDWLAVEREAFRLTGNESMLLPATRSDEPVFPEGDITIMDPEYSAEPVGVKGVRIVCNSFVKLAMSYTDENGHYKMGRSYSTDLRYRLIFKNVKGFNQGLNMILLPASVSALGTHPAEGCSVTVDNYSDYNLFVRCVVNNAGFDYYQAREKSSGAIPAPVQDLRIWDLPLFYNSFNIMMHHGVLIETFAPLREALGEITIIAKIAQPDVYLGLEGCGSYQEAYGRALLVFAQAGLFGRVGKSWWHEYIVSAVGSGVMDSFAELLSSIGGSKGGKGTYVDIVHYFSNYCRTVLYRRHYPGSQDIFGDRMYTPQLFMYLDERGLGLESVAQLFSSDVCDMGTLKEKMLSYYPQFKTVILEAFERYENTEIN